MFLMGRTQGYCWGNLWDPRDNFRIFPEEHVGLEYWGWIDEPKDMILACPQATILNAKQDFCYLFSSRSTSKTGWMSCSIQRFDQPIKKTFKVWSATRHTNTRNPESKNRVGIFIKVRDSIFKDYSEKTERQKVLHRPCSNKKLHVVVVTVEIWNKN